MIAVIVENVILFIYLFLTERAAWVEAYTKGMSGWDYGGSILIADIEQIKILNSISNSIKRDTRMRVVYVLKPNDKTHFG